MEAEKSKHRQYGDAVRNGPHKLLPLVFETYGACGPELHRHLEAIREEEAWLDKHACRQETLEMREKRLRVYKKAPFAARRLRQKCSLSRRRLFYVARRR